MSVDDRAFLATDAFPQKTEESPIGDSRFSNFQVIGQGAMGTVYKAWDSTLDRYVAIKVVKSGRESVQSLLTRFGEEAKILGKLEHSNIVTIYDAKLDVTPPYIVMALIEGNSLSSLIQSVCTLEVRLALRVAREIAEGLAAAHQKGLIHKDIKPANVLLNLNGEVKIVDFGLSCTVSNSEQTIAGTPAYMAPEQAAGLAIDHRVDIYALGAVFFEMLTGALPFPEASNGVLSAINAHKRKARPRPTEARRDLNLPAAVDVIVSKAMAINRDERYQSAQELIQALSAIERSLQPKSRAYGLWFIAAASLLLLLSIYFFANRGPEIKKDPMAPFIGEVSALASPEERLVKVIAELKRVNPLLSADDIQAKQETHHDQTGSALYFKRGAKVSDWRPIRALRNDLVCLVAQDCKLSDASILAECHRLKTLDLSYTGELKVLTALELAEVYLRDTGVSSLEFLRGNKSLVKLVVVGCPLEIKNFDALKETGILILYASIDGDDVIELPKMLPNVELFIF